MVLFEVLFLILNSIWLKAVVVVNGEISNGKTVSEMFNSPQIEECIAGASECKVNQATVEEISTGQMFGPKFQKVHLELPRINPVHTGYSRRIKIVDGQYHEMKTLAIHPPIFEIKNFLSSDECDAIIHLAKEKGMKKPFPFAKDVGIPVENKHWVFDKWDKNLDGSLSFDEVSGINEIKHLLLTKDDILKMYNELGIEVAEDGRLSYGELERITFKKFGDYLQNISLEKAEATVRQTEQTWLWHDEDELLLFDDVFQQYHQRIANLTKIPKEIIEESEPLQVTVFKNSSFTECRHDSDAVDPRIPCCVYGATSHCRTCRFISLLYFLNDVDDGQLVFPLANNKTFLWDDLHKDTAKVCSKVPNASLSNLVIKPQKGTAIMWYNHYIGRDTGWMSDLDPLSFYGTSQVGDKEKWIATTWINILGDGVNELRPWKMGANWLSPNNKKKHIIEMMRNDDFIEGLSYLHDPKLTAVDEIEELQDSSLQTGQDKIAAQANFTKSLVNVTENDGKIQNTTALEDGGKYKESEVKTNESRGGKIQKNIKFDANDGKNAQQKLDEEEESKPEDGKLQNVIVDSKAPKDIDDKKTSESVKGQDPSTDEGEGPLGPPLRNHFLKQNNIARGQDAKESFPYVLPSGKMIENKVVMSVLMLIDELTRDELEIIARTLHEKLQLACIPIMVNPIGPM